MSDLRWKKVFYNKKKLYATKYLCPLAASFLTVKICYPPAYPTSIPPARIAIFPANQASLSFTPSKRRSAIIFLHPLFPAPRPSASCSPTAPPFPIHIHALRCGALRCGRRPDIPAADAGSCGGGPRRLGELRAMKPELFAAGGAALALLRLSGTQVFIPISISP